MNPVGWFEIYVDDMERARRFYETVLAVRLQKMTGPDFEMWGFPASPGASGSSGALIHTPGYPAGHNSVVVYFHTPDCAVEAGRVEAAGGRIHRPKMSIGAHGYIALIVDTEGTMVGLHSTV